MATKLEVLKKENAELRATIDRLHSPQEANTVNCTPAETALVDNSRCWRRQAVIQTCSQLRNIVGESIKDASGLRDMLAQITEFETELLDVVG